MLLLFFIFTVFAVFFFFICYFCCFVSIFLSSIVIEGARVLFFFEMNIKKLRKEKSKAAIHLKTQNYLP